MWRPVNDDHSIETMSIVVGFQDAVSSLVYRNMNRKLDETTNKNGLNIHQPIQGIEFRVDQAGVTPRPININGMAYQRNSLIRLRSGEVVNKMVEQIQFQPQSLHYSTWKYTRWAPTLESLRRIIFPALEIACAAVTISSIRIEYIDRFVFTGADFEMKPSDVLSEESPLIARDIFSADDLWHSHTGKFVLTNEQKKRLLQVNIDAQELLSSDGTVASKSISIMNSVEDRYLESGWEPQNIDEQIGVELDDLHKESKILYSKILNPKMASKVGLA